MDKFEINWFFVFLAFSVVIIGGLVSYEIAIIDAFNLGKLTAIIIILISMVFGIIIMKEARIIKGIYYEEK
jgi:branched-subunit amino acid ABC-type transport system permease component